MLRARGGPTTVQYASPDRDRASFNLRSPTHEAGGRIVRPSVATAPRDPSLPSIGFRFVTRPRRPLPDEPLRFSVDLRMALRVASGLGVHLGLTWLSGPAGGCVVRVPSGTGDAWFRESLSPVYGVGQWRTDGGSAESLAAVADIRPAGPAELPLPDVAEGPAWAQPVLAGLVLLPRGYRLTWDLAPSPARATPSRWERPLEPEAATVLQRPAPPSRLERATRDRTAERVRELRWVVRGRLHADPTTDRRDTGRVHRLLASASHLAGGNFLGLARPFWGLGREPHGFVVSEGELLGFWPPPWAAGPGPEAIVPRLRGFPLGTSSTGRSVELTVEPGQGRHLVILGETGMGKSSLLVGLLRRAARAGTVVLLDPLGETGRALLESLGPIGRERALWISPTRSRIGMNALAPAAFAGERGERAIRELVAALRRVRTHRFADGGFWGPRIEEVLGRSLRLAAQLPGGTLSDAWALLSDEPTEAPVPDSARARVHGLQAFARERPEEVAGSRRVLGEIVSNPTLRQMLCDRRGRFDWGVVGQPGRVVVATGDAAESGETTARYLMAIDLALLWSEVLSRPRASKIFVGLDEIQGYAHDGLLEMLRLGRRCNLHVWAATQSLRSVGEELREGLLTNSADLLLFRGDPEEAREFTRWNTELTVGSLMSLPRGHAVALLGKASRLSWVVTPVMPRESESTARLTEVARRSRAAFATAPTSPASSAEAAPYAPTDSPAPAGLRADGFPSLAVARFLLRSWSESSTERVLVPLRTLRETVPLGEAELRELGRELGGAHAIVRRRRDADGPVWELDPEVCRTLERSPIDPTTESRLRGWLATHVLDGVLRPPRKDD